MVCATSKGSDQPAHTRRLIRAFACTGSSESTLVKIPHCWKSHAAAQILLIIFSIVGECCEISLEVFVDKDSAYRLNSGEEKLEDILVLHLHGGKDFFISFAKTPMPSYVSYLPEIFGQINLIKIRNF